jgi:hypothetical protein
MDEWVEKKIAEARERDAEEKEQVVPHVRKLRIGD